MLLLRSKGLCFQAAWFGTLSLIGPRSSTFSAAAGPDEGGLAHIDSCRFGGLRCGLIERRKSRFQGRIVAVSLRDS